MSKQVVALLPIKAHSERVEGKNFRDMNGKPLFRWILDTLLEVPVIEKIIINTDARDKLKENGLKESDRILVRDRLPEICGDHISMNSILADDIANISADIYIMTHTTNPLLSSNTISRALEKFIQESNRFDSLFSVNRIQSRFYRKNGQAINHDPDKLVRTQDLEPWYEENSNLYIFTRDSFRRTNARIGKSPLMFETPKLESFDIDTPDDWEICNLLSSCITADSATLS